MQRIVARVRSIVAAVDCWCQAGFCERMGTPAERLANGSWAKGGYEHSPT
jgi:hypothetical protein